MRKGALNLLTLRGVLQSQNAGLSVNNTSRALILFLDELSRVDPIFNSFVPLKRPNTTIDIQGLGTEGAINKLNEYFLSSTNWTHDVPAWDRTSNPTLDSKLSTGFQFNFEFREGDEARFSMTGNISSDFRNPNTPPHMLNFQYFNTETDHVYSFAWYESLLKSYVSHWQPKEASIIYHSSEWLNMNVKTGIGRISYFSNNYDRFEIPNDLSEVQYRPGENGRFLYVCPEFVPEVEAFRAAEAKTVSVMKELLSRVSGYSKNN